MAMVARTLTASSGCAVRCGTRPAWAVEGAAVAMASAAAGTAATAGISGPGAAGAVAGSVGAALVLQRVLRLRLVAGSGAAGA